MVLNKAFPELSSFTIALWVKAAWSGRSRAGTRSSTVLSYTDKPGNQPMVKISLNPELRLELHNQEINTGVRLSVSKWTHLVWTQVVEGMMR